MAGASPTSPSHRSVNGGPPAATKVCTNCLQSKPLSAFPRNPQLRDGRNSWCTDCCSSAKREQRRRNPVRTRILQRANRWGLEWSSIQRAFDAQGQRCAICGEPAVAPDELVVDHNHATGEVRGLLCNGCNRGLGYFNDSPKALRRAATYLRAQGPFDKRVRSLLRVAPRELPPRREKAAQRPRGPKRRGRPPKMSPPPNHPALF
jgi:hypothetical protein